jgi:hypothetical protein
MLELQKTCDAKDTLLVTARAEPNIALELKSKYSDELAAT